MQLSCSKNLKPTKLATDVNKIFNKYLACRSCNGEMSENTYFHRAPTEKSNNFGSDRQKDEFVFKYKNIVMGLESQPQVHDKRQL